MNFAMDKMKKIPLLLLTFSMNKVKKTDAEREITIRDLHFLILPVCSGAGMSAGSYERKEAV